jgi:dGTPase
MSLEALMSIREKSEEIESIILSNRAVMSKNTAGRLFDEEKCTIRTEFQRDRDRILHCKSFRRLKHKTQVFLSPEGDHYRTRLTHTLEVSQIARTVSRALRLNEDLAEAIALGHDIGHTPFGHSGEFILNRVHEGGFKHNEQSLRVVDILEEHGNGKAGLNLTAEVRDGILNHNGPIAPFTLEGQIVKISDRIAYINHDIDDAIRAGVISLSEIPRVYIDRIGETHSSRINFLIHDMVETSAKSDTVRFSDDVEDVFSRLREFMFERVYYDKDAKKEEGKAMHVVESLYGYFVENPSKMPSDEYEQFLKTKSLDVVKDYIAGMCDRYAIKRYKEIYVPTFWK